MELEARYAVLYDDLKRNFDPTACSCMNDEDRKTLVIEDFFFDRRIGRIGPDFPHLLRFEGDEWKRNRLIGDFEPNIDLLVIESNVIRCPDDETHPVIFRQGDLSGNVLGLSCTLNGIYDDRRGSGLRLFCALTTRNDE